MTTSGSATRRDDIFRSSFASPSCSAARSCSLPDSSPQSPVPSPAPSPAAEACPTPSRSVPQRPLSSLSSTTLQTASARPWNAESPVDGSETRYVVTAYPTLMHQLLSLPSSDLDIALSIPSGHSFAVAFVDFLKAKDVPTGSVGKVVANPEQSKHLETGTTRIMGLECDFVGLRSETYADSRIPQVVGPTCKFNCVK